MSLRGMLGGGATPSFAGYPGPRVGAYAAPFVVRKQSTPPASVSFGEEVGPRR